MGTGRRTTRILDGLLESGDTWGRSATGWTRYHVRRLLPHGRLAGRANVHLGGVAEFQESQPAAGDAVLVTRRPENDGQGHVGTTRLRAVGRLRRSAGRGACPGSWWSVERGCRHATSPPLGRRSALAPRQLLGIGLGSSFGSWPTRRRFHVAIDFWGTRHLARSSAARALEGCGCAQRTPTVV